MLSIKGTQNFIEFLSLLYKIIARASLIFPDRYERIIANCICIVSCDRWR